MRLARCRAVLRPPAPATRPAGARSRPARRRRRFVDSRCARLVGRADHRAVGAQRRGRQDRRARCRCRRLPDQALRHGRIAGAGTRQLAPSTRRRRIGDDPAEALFRFGEVELDRAARIVRRSGAEVHLTPTEYRLLGVLVANAGRVLTQRQLLREVWGPSHTEQSHYLRIYMGHLRQKLEADPAQPRHLLTETAVGYRLVGFMNLISLSRLRGASLVSESSSVADTSLSA
jgi:DNA-binding response OmpR family regulator